MVETSSDGLRVGVGSVVFVFDFLETHFSWLYIVPVSGLSRPKICAKFDKRENAQTESSLLSDGKPFRCLPAILSACTDNFSVLHQDAQSDKPTCLPEIHSTLMS